MLYKDIRSLLIPFRFRRQPPSPISNMIINLILVPFIRLCSLVPCVVRSKWINRL